MSDLLTLHPIGLVHRDDRSAWLEIDPPYRGGLLELGRFSHIIVLWWVSGHDSDESRAMLQTELPYAPGVTAGVFSCRSEYRPNPIAITTCKLTGLDDESGKVAIANIDAYDGSPVIDIKPYIGVVDRVAEVTTPDWFEGWPEWMPDEGIGLYED